MNVRFERPDIRNSTGMLVDMHFHSRYSHDSSTSIQSIVEKCQELGVHVALTDHNAIQGVIEAERIAPGVVKPAIELTTKEGKDILIYFYRVEDLTLFFDKHVRPRLKNKLSLRSGRTPIGTEELFTLLSQYKCVTALAHPFAVGPRRSYRFFRNGRSDLLRFVQAFEVVNQAVPHKRNLEAIGWCVQCSKRAIGGSDGHIISMLGSAFTRANASTWEEFLDEVLEGNVTIFGEEKKLRHHVANMSRILKEKARILENRRIRNEG